MSKKPLRSIYEMDEQIDILTEQVDKLNKILDEEFQKHKAEFNNVFLAECILNAKLTKVNKEDLKNYSEDTIIFIKNN
jgi:hypothetical protein